ncbi:MAG: family 2A encapsulin nanocompartment cargo protein cysteine desulfurase [Polyangiaceae bacterium]
MNTNDPSDAAAFSAVIAELASQYLSAAPASVPHGSLPGASGATLPPTPGILQTPPLASGPLPKESDLRGLRTQFADRTGIGATPAVGDGPAPLVQPYFMQLAGLPHTLPGHAPPSAIAPSAAVAPPALGGAPASAAAPASAPSGFGTAPFDLPPSPFEAVPSFELTAPLEATAPVDAPSPALPDSSSLDISPVLTGLDQADLRDDSRLRTGIFDPHAVRRDFPILSERVNGKRLVWLDNAATTQKPRAVIDRLTHFYEHENSNIHRGAHTLAARATDAYESGRESVRRFVNAPSTNEIIFARGATEAINLVAQSWGRRHVAAGDEIVVTWLEHHANIVPWQQLCAEKGAKLRVAPVDERGQVKLEEFERLLGPRTRLVSFTQVSNALGTVTPAREMVEIAHRYGARVLVDGAQSVSHMRSDVQALDCDFFVFSGHKVFAPTGIGALYGKADALKEMPPWQGGGNMIADVTFERTVYQDAPFKFEAGTGNIADAAGLGAALDYLSGLGIENVARYEHELLCYATERLLQVPGLRLLGTAPDKASVLSFVLDGHKNEDVGAALNQEGIAVRSGHHCAQPILRRFGLESSVRASLALYNVREDVDALVSVLHRLQANGAH